MSEDTTPVATNNGVLEKLTPEQEALMCQIRDEWLAKAFNNPKMNEEQARTGIEWVYAKAGLTKPEVRCLPSPLAIQLEANRVKNDGVLPDPKDMESFSFEWMGWGDYGWVSFYDFFKRIGIVQNEDFDRYLDFVNSGIYDFLAFEGLALVTHPPTSLHRDAKGELSNTEGPAIGWSDGYCLHYINGVFFEKELWERVVGLTMTGKEILSLENMEQRMIAIKLKGVLDLLDDLNAKSVSKTERNELFAIDEVFGEDVTAYFLKYTCPSTGRVYLKPVDPDKVRPGINADDLQALSHHMNLEQYTDLRASGRES